MIKGAALALALAAALAPAAWAQPSDAQASPSDAAAVADFKARLADDGVLDSLAQRLLHSSFGPQISQSPDDQDRVADIEGWIRAHPDEASGLAVGLARDDAAGTHAFEAAMNGEVQQGRFVFNPGSKDGIYGRLRKTSRNSQLLEAAAGDGMHAEEQSEVMRSLFEGKSGDSSKIITQQASPPPPDSGQPASAASGVLGAGYYDRLGRGNLHGYSPQLQSLQSALNQRRPPGAPKLIETGRLDYATLSFPGYALRYDIGNLEQRLRLSRNFALAKALGLTQGLTRDKLLDPGFEAQLMEKARGSASALDPLFARRERALENAAAATRAFDQAALAAQSPGGITRRLLSSLGGKQKEAARWITAANLEDELQRLQGLDGFLSGGLFELIGRCPVTAGDRDEYRRRGDEYEERLKKLIADDAGATAALESDGWKSQAAAIQAGMDGDATLRRSLEPDIADYVKTPYLFAQTVVDEPRWRRWVDDAVLEYLPSTSYGRRLAAAKTDRSRLRDVFLKIAMGERGAAHAILAAEDPQ